MYPGSENEIALKQIDFRKTTRVERVAYETVTEYSNLVAMSDSRVVGGVYGEETTVLREKLVDGEVVSYEVVSRQRTREPETKRVLQGRALRTPRSQRDFPEIELVNGRPVNYIDRMSGRASAYTAGPTARTATGRTLEVGTVAVDPRIIPYGSLLYIISGCGNYVYGSAVAADTGGFIHWGTILLDLFMGFRSEENDRDMWNWGVRDVDVYIINTGIH